MSLTLVIMAAGLASRYGGAKQIVIVADTRKLSGLMAWWANLYNESHGWFTFLTIIIVPLVEREPSEIVSIFAITPATPRKRTASAFAFISVSCIFCGILFPARQPVAPAAMIAIAFTSVPTPGM